jgi:hypothetical protein
MGDVSRPSLRSSGLRLLLRLVSVVAALVVLSVSGRASAASNPNRVVPMCGDRNESIAAPPIFRAQDTSAIVAGPCQSDVLGAGDAAPLAPERVVIQERPERVLGFSALWLTQSASSLLSVERAVAALERPGFVSALLRPPRA